MVKICPRCHHNNSDDALWCKNCKYRLVKHIGLEENIKKPEDSDPKMLESSMPFFIREEKKIRKKIGFILIIIALIIMLPTFYIVLTESNQPVENVEFEKFIGKWVSTDNNSEILIFNKNGSCIFKNIEGSFKVRKGSITNKEPNELVLEIEEQKTNQYFVYTYDFNEEKNRLTLKNIKPFEHSVEEKFRKN